MAKKKEEKDKKEGVVTSTQNESFDFSAASAEATAVPESLKAKPVADKTTTVDSKAAVKPAGTPTKVNKDIPLGNGEYRQGKTFTAEKSAEKSRRDQYADEAIDSVAKWMQDTGGQPLTEESLANILTPKQLWHFQKKYNKGSNWGNALGGRAFFGNLNDKTVQLLTEQANAKIAANKKAAEEKKTYVPYGDATFEINSSHLKDIKDWGNTVSDDNITPEQAQALYSKLESYGLTVPKKTIPVLDANGKETKDENGNVITQEVYDTDGITDINTLYNKLSVIDGNDDNADVLDALGFRDGAENIVRPHRKTYEEILAEQDKKKQELDYINQQKALARQQARLGLADLAAGIGDIIKASGGALVDRRDYKNMYDQLTAQQQTNFNNYLARMEALKQEEKAKQRLAEERAYNEKLQATLHERDMEKILQAQGFQASEADKGRKHQAAQSENERIWRSKESEKQRSHEMDMLMKKLEAEAKELEDKLGAEAAKNVTKGRKIYINNKELPANDDLYGELYAYFTTFGSRKYTTKDGKQAVLNFDKLKTEEFNTEDSKVAIALQVQKALRDYSSFNDNMKSQIMSLILQEDTPISLEGASGSTTVTNTKNGLGRFGQQ